MASAATFTSNADGPKWDITYDTDKYLFKTDVAVGTDLWLAFGNDCNKVDCDIAQFLTTGLGSIKDAYGKLTSPRTDFINDFKNTSVTKSEDGKTMSFSATRVLAPTDVIGKDFKLECGKENEFTWVLKPSGDTGSWTFKLNDDCTVYTPPAPEPTNDNSGDATEEPAGAKTLAATTVAAFTVMATLF